PTFGLGDGDYSSCPVAELRRVLFNAPGGRHNPKDAMAARQQIRLRLTIGDPVPGVAYSLRNKKNDPVGLFVAEDLPVSFDVPVDVVPGPRFLGEFVRSRGPTRRFVYIAIGGQAGDSSSLWSRRAKIDIH